MDRFICLVIGGTGAGKTELLTGKDGHVSPAILDKCPRPIYAIDPMSEIPSGNHGVIYDGELDPQGRHPARGFQRAVSERLTTHKDRHIFRFPSRRHSLTVAQAIDVLRIIDSAGLPGTIYIEEADLYSDAKDDPEPVENMIFRGRHARQSLIFSARRPARISKDMLSQALQHVVILFQTVYSSDSSRFSRLFKNVKDLSDLPQYEYVVGGQRADTVPFSSILDPYDP